MLERNLISAMLDNPGRLSSGEITPSRYRDEVRLESSSLVTLRCSFRANYTEESVSIDFLGLFDGVRRFIPFDAD